MRGLRLLPGDINLSFIPHRKIFFVISVLLVVSSISIYLKNGLNYGIDFKGGILIEIKTIGGPANIKAMRSNLSGLGMGEIGLQEFGAPDEVLIRIQAQEGGEKAQQLAIGEVKKALGNGIEYRRTEFVGPKISDELFWNGVYAVSAAIFAILVYVWFRFEWHFSIGAILALVHDVISTIGVFALFGLEFNLSTVAAILTIAGYSINDTVVVFDRVRENLRRYKTLPFGELLNKSVNETLARTVMTSVTTLLALTALYVLGGEVISGFSFAMIWGVVAGTYSSIFIASAILIWTGVKRDWSKSNAEAGTQVPQ